MKRRMDLVVTHTGGDFDSLASLVAAKKIYPRAHLLFPGSQEKTVREFVSLCKDLVRIESEKDIRLSMVSRLIIVDTRLKNRLGKASELIGKKDVEVHIYDHHPKTPFDIKADYEISKRVGATVTILVNLIKKKKIKITPLEATIMALGIYEDTGSLTFRTTTKEDVDTVSFLISKGADLAVVSSYLSRELSDEEMSALVSLIQSTESHLINGIRVAISTIKTTQYVGDLSVLVHKLIDIENFNIFFVMAQAENKVHIVARSRLEIVNVDRIMRKFGGGGHSSAASAVVRETSLRYVKKKLIEILKKEIKPPLRAKDIMSTPVKTVTPDQIIEEVRETMIRYNLGGMPVIKRGKLIGIITRTDADKAIYHGFGHSRVKGYMSTDLVTAKPDTPIYELQKIMFEEDIGRLPILKRGRLTGIVTRTDLLRTVHEELMMRMARSKGEGRTEEKTLFEENTTKFLKEQLPKEIFDTLKIISEEASRGNFRVYLVGGFVRDLLLKVKNYDIDIVVEGQAIEFAKKLSKVLGGRVIIHRRFQTAILITRWPGIKNLNKKTLRIDFATARREYYEFPAALPKVELSSLKNDLYRRDFTINAMAISLNKDSFGMLIDFFGGRKDLSLGRIKVLHNLSFVEDPTRIFRAVRFEQRYNFKIDKQTEHLIRTAVSLDMFKKIAGERLREEIVYILSEEEPLKGIKRMAQLHELRFIHPKIKWSSSLERFLKRTKQKIDWFIGQIKEEKIEIWLIYFMVLLKDLNYKELFDVAQKFMLSNKDKIKILSFKKNSASTIKVLRRKKLSASHIFNQLRDKSFEEMVLYTTITNSKLIQKRIEDYVHIYSKIQLYLTGEDLKRIGVRPSPELGEILKKLLDAKINGALKSREDEIDFVKTLFKKSKR
jgi:tRNA nucleotidyltransferase (CCA-adding enzyme)